MLINATPYPAWQALAQHEPSHTGKTRQADRGILSKSSQKIAMAQGSQTACTATKRTIESSQFMEPAMGQRPCLLDSKASQPWKEDSSRNGHQTSDFMRASHYHTGRSKAARTVYIKPSPDSRSMV